MEAINKIKGSQLTMLRKTHRNPDAARSVLFFRTETPVNRNVIPPRVKKPTTAIKLRKTIKVTEPAKGQASLW
jgi:hypothetical protein